MAVELLVLPFDFPRSLINLALACLNGPSNFFGRKKAHTRERSSMQSVTFLAIKLVVLYHQNSTVTMLMYALNPYRFGFFSGMQFAYN